MTDRPQGREILFEITRVGESLRVCAVDAQSGLEVVTLVPANVSQADARALALKKLIWRLGKETSEDGAK